MSYAAPLELVTDAAGSVTFGWVEDGVFYARFSRCLSAKLGEVFASRLREAAAQSSGLQYFGDGRALESYDLLARSAFVRVVSEQRRKFDSLTLLKWEGGELSAAFLSTLGDNVTVAQSATDFEARLLALAPRARAKLGAKQDPPPRSRWPLRR
jgi:hypothetical protein